MPGHHMTRPRIVVYKINDLWIATSHDLPRWRLAGESLTRLIHEVDVWLASHGYPTIEPRKHI